MQIISKIKPIIEKAIGRQTVYENKEYCCHPYCTTLIVADGMLLYNALTKEMLFLDSEEAASLRNSGPYPDTLRKELIAHWFLIPSDTDGKELCGACRIRLLSS